MHMPRRLAPSLGFFLGFCLYGLTSSAPTSSNRLNAATESRLTLLQPANNSLGPATVPGVNISHSMVELGPSASTNLSTQVGRWQTNWYVSDDLYMSLTIEDWKLAPEKVVQTLALAQTAVGKKSASALLDKKFKQTTGSRLNTMLFEIEPVIGTNGLTWGDAAEVLGDEYGLPKFFEETQAWNSVYFDLRDDVRGMVGQGAVRKWYMLESNSASVA